MNQDSETRRLRRVCVFCGSSPGASPAYRAAGAAFGRTLAKTGIGMVYGGASVGVMGAAADAALAAGGEVIGVIPRVFMDLEVAHDSLHRLHVVETMHERKAQMADLADAFVALPGGIGTLEDLFEVWTWGQIGYHSKPCALLEVNGFWAPLRSFLDHVVEQGFLQPGHRAMLCVDEEPAALLEKLRRWRPAIPPKIVGQVPL